MADARIVEFSSERHLSGKFHSKIKIFSVKSVITKIACCTEWSFRSFSCRFPFKFYLCSIVNLSGMGGNRSVESTVFQGGIIYRAWNCIRIEFWKTAAQLVKQKRFAKTWREKYLKRRFLYPATVGLYRERVLDAFSERLLNVTNYRISLSSLYGVSRKGTSWYIHQIHH
jgi:hypothetical protein